MLCVHMCVTVRACYGFVKKSLHEKINSRKMGSLRIICHMTKEIVLALPRRWDFFSLIFFFSLCVCLYVCLRDCTKTIRLVFMNFGRKMRHGKGKNPRNFVMNTNCFGKTIQIVMISLREILDRIFAILPFLPFILHLTAKYLYFQAAPWLSWWQGQGFPLAQDRQSWHFLC